MSDIHKQLPFYGPAHPELATIAGDDLDYFSRLVAVKLARETLARCAEMIPVDRAEVDRRLDNKLSMELELSAFQSAHGYEPESTSNPS